jgi:hypothetical protein
MQFPTAPHSKPAAAIARLTTFVRTGRHSVTREIMQVHPYTCIWCSAKPAGKAFVSTFASGVANAHALARRTRVHVAHALIDLAKMFMAWQGWVRMRDDVMSSAAACKQQSSELAASANRLGNHLKAACNGSATSLLLASTPSLPPLFLRADLLERLRAHCSEIAAQRVKAAQGSLDWALESAKANAAVVGPAIVVKIFPEEGVFRAALQSCKRWAADVVISWGNVCDNVDKQTLLKKLVSSVPVLLTCVGAVQQASAHAQLQMQLPPVQLPALDCYCVAGRRWVESLSLVPPARHLSSLLARPQEEMTLLQAQAVARSAQALDTAQRLVHRENVLAASFSLA